MEKKVRDEQNCADSDKIPFEKLREEIETRSDRKFDVKLQEAYAIVIKKAQFLLKLTIPKAFTDAKQKEKMDRNSEPNLVKTQSTNSNEL